MGCPSRKRGARRDEGPIPEQTLAQTTASCDRSISDEAKRPVALPGEDKDNEGHGVGLVRHLLLGVSRVDSTAHRRRRKRSLLVPLHLLRGRCGSADGGDRAG